MFDVVKKVYVDVINNDKILYFYNKGLLEICEVIS